MDFQENQTVGFKREWKDEWLKWICAFANAQGGTLYIGIDDSTKKVIGIEKPEKLMEDLPSKIVPSLGIYPEISLEDLEGKKVILIKVQPATYPVSFHGEYHIRCGATKQILSGAALTSFLESKRIATWEDVPIDNVSTSELDSESFEIFRRSASANQRMSAPDLALPNECLLKNLGLIKKSRLTKAAILLFHKHPELWFPNCYARLCRFRDDAEILCCDEIYGSLFFQAERIMDFLFSKYLEAQISYDNIIRVEKFPYSKLSVRELVYNALMHQDFTCGSPIKIGIRPDELRISNSGCLPSGWTISTLMKRHESVPRNPKIANAFYRAGFIEAWGRGIHKVIAECKCTGTPVPNYELFSEYTTAIVYPHLKTNEHDKGCEISEKMMNLLIGLSKEDLGISALMQILQLSDKKSFRKLYIDPLISKGLIKYSMPENLNSSSQKYCLTVEGQKYVKDVAK